MSLVDRVRNWMRSANNLARVEQLCCSVIDKNMKVLEIGPGYGQVLRYLAAYSAEMELGLELHALDHHEYLLRMLPEEFHKHLFELETLKDTTEGLCELPFKPATFDLIILTEVIEHLTFPQIMISEIARVLKPRGTVILTTPNAFSLGNRLATLLGTDKIFRRVGSEGFIATIEYSPYGHVAHYSFQSLAGLLQPWFDIIRRDASNFHVPIFLYIQPIMTRLFKSLANHIVVLARRRPGETRLRIVPCALTDLTELTLPDGRCLHPMAHSHICNNCPYFHKDFLHPRDHRNRPGYTPETR